MVSLRLVPVSGNPIDVTRDPSLGGPRPHVRGGRRRWLGLEAPRTPGDAQRRVVGGRPGQRKWHLRQQPEDCRDHSQERSGAAFWRPGLPGGRAGGCGGHGRPPRYSRKRRCWPRRRPNRRRLLLPPPRSAAPNPGTAHTTTTSSARQPRFGRPGPVPDPAASSPVPQMSGGAAPAKKGKAARSSGSPWAVAAACFWSPSSEASSAAGPS